MKQKNRNTRLLISLSVLMVALAVVLFVLKDEDRVMVDPTLFKAQDIGKIDRVVLESARGKVNLHYDSLGWKINGRFEADRQLITVLFATLEQATPKRPVGAGQRDSVAARMDTSAVTISLYEGAELKKSFQAGGDSHKKEAWFRLTRAAEPFVVSIPGYRIYVSQIFELTENGWRDKRIFDFRWKQLFNRLTSTFPADPALDIEVRMKNDIVAITNLEKVDTSRLLTYLDDLSQLAADQILAPGESRRFDSLARTNPIHRTKVSDIAGRVYELALFPPVSGESLILGVTHKQDLVLFDRAKILKIVKQRPWFRLKER